MLNFARTKFSRVCEQQLIHYSRWNHYKILLNGITLRKSIAFFPVEFTVGVLEWVDMGMNVIVSQGISQQH